MATEMGEYLVGAYLKFELACGVVDYNSRPPGGGLQGLGELDVIGFDLPNRRIYLCEVTTHLDGLQIGKGADATISKITEKHQRQRDYAAGHLSDFNPRFMFWSPVVRSGLADRLRLIDGLELFINGAYKEAIDQLRQKGEVVYLGRKQSCFSGPSNSRASAIYPKLRRTLPLTPIHPILEALPSRTGSGW